MYYNFYFVSNNYINILYLLYLTYLSNSNHILYIYSENCIQIHKIVQQILTFNNKINKKNTRYIGI